MKAVVCDSDCLVKLLDALEQHRVEQREQEQRGGLPVEWIVTLDGVEKPQKERAAALELKLMPWEELLEKVWCGPLVLRR